MWPKFTWDVFSLFDIIVLSTDKLLLIFMSFCCSLSLLLNFRTKASFYFNFNLISTDVLFTSSSFSAMLSLYCSRMVFNISNSSRCFWIYFLNFWPSRSFSLLANLTASSALIIFDWSMNYISWILLSRSLHLSSYSDIVLTWLAMIKHLSFNSSYDLITLDCQSLIWLCSFLTSSWLIWLPSFCSC